MLALLDGQFGVADIILLALLAVSAVALAVLAATGWSRGAQAMGAVSVLGVAAYTFGMLANSFLQEYNNKPRETTS